MNTPLKAAIRQLLDERMTLLGIQTLEISDDANLMSLGILDSLGFLELLSQIEQKCNVTIDLSDIDPEKTLSISGISHICQAK